LQDIALSPRTSKCNTAHCPDSPYLVMTNKATPLYIVIVQAALSWAALFYSLFVKFITIIEEERL